MKMRDRGDVPGVTCQGARQKTAFVIDEIGGDPFNDAQGKLGDSGRLCCGSFR